MGFPTRSTGVIGCVVSALGLLTAVALPAMTNGAVNSTESLPVVVLAGLASAIFLGVLVLAWAQPTRLWFICLGIMAAWGISCGGGPMLSNLSDISFYRQQLKEAERHLTEMARADDEVGTLQALNERDLYRRLVERGNSGITLGAMYLLIGAVAIAGLIFLRRRAKRQNL